MSYQSIGFILFSAVVLLLYYILGRKLQRWVLAAANLAFYLFAGPRYLPFLLCTMLATYFAGKSIDGIYRKADEDLAGCSNAAEKKAVKTLSRKKAKRVLLFGMIASIALLAVCKYTAFVLSNINAIFALIHLPQIPIFRMILPLGISFYTFMALSYLLDVYWKRYPAEKDFLNYAVYLSYFPHVVQGPIDRFDDFREQIRDGVSFDSKNLVFGAELALWGFFKKLVIADRLNPFVTHVFDNAQSCGGLVLVVAVLTYSVQIYADFSGCIDIVTGVSEMFGIRLRKNFNHPYFSKSMAEFWRRWHISLQEWFKDYIYYPVFTSNFVRRTKKNMNAKGHVRSAELFSSCFPIMVVWLITGLWHGASWNFVVWGIYHAILLIGSQVLEPLFQKGTARLRIRTESALWRFWQMTRTFLLCSLGRIFFRAADIKSAFSYIGRIFSHAADRTVFAPEFTESVSSLFSAIARRSFSQLFTLSRDLLNVDTGYGITPANIIMSVIVIFVLWIVDAKQEKGSLRESLAAKNIVIRWIVIYAALFAVIIFGVYGPGFDASSFIYEKF